jgi:GNAT superfamily N-acetyltransferase
LPEILNLGEQLGYPNRLEDLKTRYFEILNLPDFALFVARSAAGKVVGYIQINRESATLLAGPRAEVAALIIDRAERGQGIGAALLKSAEDWAKTQELPLIRIRSNTKREGAHRFYQRNGYEIVKSWHLLTKDIDFDQR